MKITFHALQTNNNTPSSGTQKYLWDIQFDFPAISDDLGLALIIDKVSLIYME